MDYQYEPPQIQYGPRDIQYENNNIAYDDQYTKEDGGGIKCKHFELCNSVLPKWWFECKATYICTQCDMYRLGYLNFKMC